MENQTEKHVKLLYLENGEIIISKIEEIVADIGEPNCKLSDPYLVFIEKTTNSITLRPWLMGLAGQKVFLVSSDKILTIADPNSIISEKYKTLI